jgi:hypothetical protein
MLKNIGAVFIFLTALIIGIVVFFAERQFWFLLSALGLLFAAEIIMGIILLWLHWRGYYDPYPEQSVTPKPFTNIPPSRHNRLVSIFNIVGIVAFVFISFSLAIARNDKLYIPLFIIFHAIQISAHYLLINLYKAVKKGLNPYRRRVLS